MIQIINNDCIKALKDIETDSIDCIVTSPPYWKGFEYEAYFNSYAQYLEWCEEWLRECKYDDYYYGEKYTTEEIVGECLRVIDELTGETE